MLSKSKTIFLFVGSTHTKEVKAWKSDIIKAKHKSPTIILVSTKGASKTKVAELQSLVDACESIVYDPVSGEGVYETLDCVCKAMASVSNSKKEKEKEKGGNLMSLFRKIPIDMAEDVVEEKEEKKGN